ncbi:MAG: hypothetical protein JOZ15_20760 [Acidobacteria bacterium]|nr:hypothetical protein [Acidobacteriota bacterium]
MARPGIEVVSSPGEHAVVLPYTPAMALRALGAAASEWGAELEPRAGPEGGAQLRLPVMAGLRRGLLSGPVAVEAAGRGSRVVFRPLTQDYYLETSVVALLVVAGAGALLTVAWPLFPQLLPGAPLGGVLAVGGWMLLAPRLRGKGPEEFLESVARHPGTETEAPGGETKAPGGETSRE